MHNRTRPLSIEPLEPREYLSTTTTPDSNPAGEIRANIAAALVGQGNARTETNYPALIEAMRQDPAFADLATISGAAEEEGNEWQTDKDRLSVLRLDRTERTTELQRDEASLAQAEAELLAIQTRMTSLAAQESTLAKDIAALQTKDALLHQEQAKLPSRLSAAQAALPPLQKSLLSVAKQEQAAQKTLTQFRTTYQSQQNKLVTLNALVARYPTSASYSQQRDTVNTWLLTNGPKLHTLEQQDATLRGKINLLNRQINQANVTIASLVARQAALPKEMQSADTAIGEDTALLHTTQEEEAQTVLTGEEQLRTRDAVLAEVEGDRTSLTATAATMEEVTASLTSHEEILSQLSATVRSCAAQLLADTALNTLETTPERTDALSPEAGTFSADSSTLTLPLAELGGTAQFTALRGRTVLPGTLSVADTAALRRAVLAAGLTPQQVASVPNLSTVLGIKDGQFSYQGTVTSPSLGTVTVSADTNRPSDPSKPRRYLTIRDGIIQAYETPGAMGCVPVFLTFATPRYIQWVDVRHIGLQEGATLDITAADGTVRSVMVGPGGVIMVDAMVQKLTITTGGPAAYGFRAIQEATPEAPQVPDGTWTQATGALTTLDLSGSERRVTSVDLQARSDRLGDIITAEGYSGSNKVVSQAVGADGTVHLAYEGGLTHVMFSKANKASTLLVAGCTVTGDLGLDQPNSDPLSPETNGTYGLETRPDFECDGVAYNHIEVAKKNPNVYYGGGSSAVWSGAILNLPQSTNDPTQYNRHEFRSAKSISVAKLYYVRPDGIAEVPAAYWKSIGPGFIAFKGAPEYLVVLLKGPGGSYDTVMPAKQGETCAEVMPNQTMSIESEVLVIRQGGLAEGWQDVPEAVPSANYRSNGGDTVNVLFQIMNLGMQGGTVTARIHSGPLGSIADPVAKVFTGSIGALGKTALSANVGIANAGDSVTLEVIDSNGVTTCYKRRIQQARPEEGNEARFDAVAMTHRGAMLAARIHEVLASSSPMIVGYFRSQIENADATEAMRQRLIEQTILEVVEEVEPDLTEEEKRYKVMGLTASANTDLDQGWEWEGGIDTYDDMLKWFQSNGFRAPGVQENTAMGKIFLGLVQKLIAHADTHAGTQPTGTHLGITYDPDFEDFVAAAKAVQDITGIDAHKILHAADLQQSFPDRASAEQAMVAALKKLFSDGQYKEMLGGQCSGTPSILGVHVDKPILNGSPYTDSDDGIFVRFDLSSPDLKYDHANVYITSPSGMRYTLPTDTLIPDFDGKLGVRITRADFLRAFPDGLQGNLRVELDVYFASVSQPSKMLSEEFVSDIKGNLAFSAKDIIGEAAWDSLTDAQRTKFEQAFNFGDLSDTPKNRQMIDWLMQNYMTDPAGKMKLSPSSERWKGTAYDNLVFNEDGSPALKENGEQKHNNFGQCKWWIQQIVVPSCTGMSIPNNDEHNDERELDYQWNSDSTVQLLAQETDRGLLDETLQNIEVCSAGNIIQYVKDNYQHTVIVGAKTSTGIWVFDSNFELDQTPEYHFISYSELDSVISFSIYRLTQ